jgi:hypothetical protein
MRSVSVQFPSGREVLRSYWGFLHQGGLVLPDHDLSEGDAVLLDVRIKSLKQSYRLPARVVRRGAGDGRTFVAFNGGEAQDLMLNAAWADSHDVPQRKHRRVSVEGRRPRTVRYRLAGDTEARASGVILDVSAGGCRLRGDLVVPVGTRIQLLIDRPLSAGSQPLEGPQPFDGLQPLDGQVRWTTPGREMGIEFSRPELVLRPFLGG